MRIPDVRRLACARLASITADFLLPVTLAFLVLVPLRGSATGLGFVLGAHVAGNFLFRLIGSAWTDRVRPQRVMLASNLGSAAIQAAVLGLYLAHVLAVPVLAGLMLWRGIASAFFDPAANSLRARVVPSAQRVAGNALLGLVPAVAVVAGPLAGFGLLAGAGVVGVLAFEVTLLLLSAGSVARMRGVGEYRPVMKFRAGLREVVRRRRLLRAVGLLVAINLVAAGPLLTLTAVGGGGTLGYAAILSAIGLGAVVGGIFGGYLRVRPSMRNALLCLVPAAVGPLVFALRAPLVLEIVAFVLVGAVQSVHGVLWSTTLRAVLPREAFGPVSSFEELTSLAVLPVGQVLGGLALDRWGLTITAWAVVAGLFALPLLGGAPPPRPRTRRGRAGIRTGSPASAASR
jgi:MFS family permease